MDFYYIYLYLKKRFMVDIRHLLVGLVLLGMATYILLYGILSIPVLNEMVLFIGCAGSGLVALVTGYQKRC
tara:strand:- start:29 stop:241 length:213 start_codon:yes stop_codon:yes gene_type:complete